MLTVKMEVDLDGDWTSHLPDGDNNGLQMLGTVRTNGVIGALGFHVLMDTYWMGVQFGKQTHWHRLDDLLVREALRKAWGTRLQAA